MPRLGGGAANTGVALARAGHHVTLVAVVGSDPEADWILDEISRAGIETAAIARVQGPSTRSLILLDPDGERTIVNLHRCVEPEPPERLRDLAADALYVRSREQRLARLLADRLASMLVVAHVPPTETGARPAHVLVASVSDLAPGQRRSPWKLGAAVAGDALRWFVLTRGAAGADAVAPRRRLHAAAPAVRVVDSTGAGDVFAAGLVHALLAGEAMQPALELACAWGAAQASRAPAAATVPPGGQGPTHPGSNRNRGSGRGRTT